jgi:hypothetical protein
MVHWDFQPTNCNLTPSIYQQNEALALSSLPHLARNVPHRDVECDASRLIDALLEQNWTMAFVGHSLTTLQSFIALECELHRRGIYDVKIPLQHYWETTLSVATTLSFLITGCTTNLTRWIFHWT